MTVVRLVLALFFAIVLQACGGLSIFSGSFSNANWELERVVITEENANPIVHLGLRQLRQNLREKLKNTSDDAQISQIKADIEILDSLPSRSTISFDRDFNVFGQVGCNRFSASYSWKDSDRIIVSDTAIIRKFCDLPHLVDFEVQFSKFFEGEFLVKKLKTGSLILEKGNLNIYLKPIS